MIFNTLYYNISIKIYIKNVRVYKTLRIKNVRLDYEDKKLIKRESLYNIFINYINEYIKKYNTSIDNIIIKKCNIECENDDIKFTIIDDILYVHRNDILVSEPDISIVINKNIIKIKINNYLDIVNYNLYIADGSKTTNIIMPNDSYAYHCMSKDVSINIVSSIEDTIVSEFKKDIKINDDFIGPSTTYINHEDNKNTGFDSQLFQNGLEQQNNVPYITQVDGNQEFNIKAIYKAISNTEVSIYPKVMVNYRTRLTYDYDVDAIFGNAEYTATINRDGYIKAKIVKTYAPSIKLEFNINCKATYYEKLPNKNGTYITKDINVSKSHTVDMSKFITINDDTKSVSFSNESCIKTASNESIYNTMLSEVKRLYSSAKDIKLHGYNISNIRCYNGSTLVSNKGEIIYPVFHKTIDNKIDVSKSVKYIIRPSFLYTTEDIVESNVGSVTSTILNQSSYSTLTNEFGEKYSATAGVKYKIFVLNKDDSVEYSISSNGILSAKSNKSYSVKRSYVFNNTLSSVTVDLAKELQLPSDDKQYSGSITVKCIGKPIHFAGNTLTYLNNNTINLSGNINSFVVGISGSVEKTTLTNTDILPKSGTYVAAINGNAITYDTNLKGKEDYISKEEPFLIPGNAKNIRIDCAILNSAPSTAIVTKQIIPSTDLSQYSLILKLSSNHMDKKTVKVEKYVGDEMFYDFMMPSNYELNKTLVLSKPSASYSSYSVEFESNNSNILFEHKKHIEFTSNKAYVDVLCKTTKHPSNKWELNIPKTYVYLNGNEYYTFTDSLENINVIDGKIKTESKVNTCDPVSVYNSEYDISLLRIVSTENDNISIKETIMSDNNIFYTIYNDIEISKVEDIDGNRINYECGSNYVMPSDQINKIIVVYKVKNSFDYRTNDTGTIIYINSGISTFNVYYNKDVDIKTSVSLNPVHNLLNNGVVYFYDKKEDMAYAVGYIDSFNNEHTVVIIIKDKNGNPYISNNVEIIGADGIVIDRFSNSDINGVFKYTVKSDNYNPQESINIDGRIIKVGDIL